MKETKVASVPSHKLQQQQPPHSPHPASSSVSASSSDVQQTSSSSTLDRTSNRPVNPKWRSFSSSQSSSSSLSTSSSSSSSSAAAAAMSTSKSGAQEEVQTLPHAFIVHRGRRIVKKKKRKCVKCKRQQLLLKRFLLNQGQNVSLPSVGYCVTPLQFHKRYGDNIFSHLFNYTFQECKPGRHTYHQLNYIL